MAWVWVRETFRLKSRCVCVSFSLRFLPAWLMGMTHNVRTFRSTPNDASVPFTNNSKRYHPSALRHDRSRSDRSRSDRSGSGSGFGFGSGSGFRPRVTPARVLTRPFQASGTAMFITRAPSSTTIATTASHVCAHVAGKDAHTRR